MAKYNQDLLKKISVNTTLSLKAVYNNIYRIENKTGASGNIAALLFAKSKGIAFKRYSSDDERAKMAGFTLNQSAPQIMTVSKPSSVGRKGIKQGGVKQKPLDAKSIFMIHGRNKKVNASMHSFLRAIGLKPLEFSTAIRATIKKQKKGGNPYVGDILDVSFQRVKALIVLFTPDDDVVLNKKFWANGEKANEKKLTPQARPNVIFEAGLALGRHEEKTIFVSIGKSKPFSDIAGRHMMHLNDSAASRQDFANRLLAIGCEVDVTGNDWMNTGDFST